MSFVDYLGPFLLLLGIVVVIHEYGHYAVAKWFGVKVERFSVGFGPSLLRRKVGETEYVLAWLPLGGYVKMAGELPDDEVDAEDASRSLTAQSPSRRIGIYLAGPVMNMVLAVAVFAGMYVTGWPTPTSLIGSVLPDTPAAEAGLEAGDRIVAVDGTEVWRWVDVTAAVSESNGRTLALGIERGDSRFDATVAPSLVNGRRRLGIEQQRAAAILGLPSEGALAREAGLATGDRVVALNGEQIVDWYGFGQALAAARGPLDLEAERALDGETETLRVSLPAPADNAAWTLEALGVERVDFAIALVEPSSPAKRAGLKDGDIPLRFRSEPISSLKAFQAHIRGSGGEELELTVLRAGGEHTVKLRAEERTRPVGDEVLTAYAIGVHVDVPRVAGEMRDEHVLNPLAALWRGTVKTTQIFVGTLDGLSKLVTGKVGTENLAGPIGIGEIAGDSFAGGWFNFLFIMCVISVNLGILNLLPIPILDGGQIVFALAEMARGGPIGMRAREIAQTVGLSLIVLLMGFAFWNDLSKHWDGIVGFFRGLV